MRHSAAALALTIALAIPGAAHATSYWESYKETFKYKPHAVILALPAIVCTLPFMLVDSLINKIMEASKDEDEDE